jgi:hypothetical protein
MQCGSHTPTPAGTSVTGAGDTGDGGDIQLGLCHGIQVPLLH